MTDYARLRQTVRELVANHQDDFASQCDSWTHGFDPGFSRKLGAAGLLGMTWSREYGGQQRTYRERLVVTEELLRAGAPVSAHWIADRQIGPATASLGSDRLKHELLPGIAAGEVCICLGMSEPESGSDLASVRTRLVEEPDGSFRLTGQKVWTTNAHRADYAYVLARSDPPETPRSGLTECIVPMDSAGIDVRPIIDLGGHHHFNEMFFDGVSVPADAILGTRGDGWRQVTEQLAVERGGPERVLSTYPVLAALLQQHELIRAPDELRLLLGRLGALRQLAWRVAESLDAGEVPTVAAATLKRLGNQFEVDVLESARRSLGGAIDPRAPLAAIWQQGLLTSPGFSIRGGTSEVLSTIISRECISEVDK